MYDSAVTLKKALDTHIRRHKTMAKNGVNPDYLLAHKEEAQEANLEPPSYTQLESRIKKEHNLKVKQRQSRMEKLGRRK